MATIKFSPSDAPINIVGQTVEEWFGAKFKNPNFATKKSVGFDKDHLAQLINDQNPPTWLVLSKVDEGGNKTLALAGYDSNYLPQFAATKTVLVGSYFKIPTGTATIALNFGGYEKPSIPNPPVGNTLIMSQDWDTSYDHDGIFNDVIKEYQEKPFGSNHFSTITFKPDIILSLVNRLNCSKVAFLPGYVSLKTKKKKNNPGELPEISIVAVETLLAVAVDDQDIIIGDPVAASSGWPLVYK
jgi:hypothetical protein